MLAEDVKPDRMEATKAAVRDFIKKQPKGVKIGVVAFSDFASLVAPPSTDRKQALDAYLVARSAEGFHVESRADTHAIITRKGLVPRLLERIGMNGSKRQVISVDEHGNVTARPAEPVRW